MLISMPFGYVERPSIALGLLEASLDGPTCRTLYFNLEFAERIGAELYIWLSSGAPLPSPFLGDYLFHEAAFPGRTCDDARFLAEHPLAEGCRDTAPEDLVDRLAAARGQIQPFIDACLDTVLRLRPRIVGFTSVFQQQQASLALARRLHEAAPEVFLVFGGANCEGAMGREMIRQFAFLDAVVSGEGEIVFPDLVERVLRGEGVDDLAGVSSAIDRELERPITHAPKVARMDDLPIPDYSDFFAAWRRTALDSEVEPWLSYETSRGCWWGEKQHCTFCGLNGAGMAFRSKSGARALRELDELLARHPVARVQVVDNILDMQYFRSFIPDLATERREVELFYEVKANLSKTHLRQLRAAGITQIQPGIESLSSHILEAMGKGVSLLQNLRLLKWCEELGLRPYWNILWGFPDETPADYDAMTRLIPWLSHLTPPVVAGPLRLDRFSPYFEQSSAHGFVDIEPLPAYRHLYPVGDDALANLAYSFDYAYRDGRDPARYTAEFGRAVEAWQTEPRSGALIAVPRDEELMVWDWRAAAAAPLTVLEGAERVVYESCDTIRSLGQLARHLARDGLERSTAAIEAMLQTLVDRGLMVREGDNYLSLAVRRPLD
ncbi:MAG: RiPP maturation radical SAM C-methyltransferase [Acidobacteriota bacterium]